MNKFSMDLSVCGDAYHALSSTKHQLGLKALQTGFAKGEEALYQDFKKDLAELAKHTKWLRGQHPYRGVISTPDDKLLKAIFG